MDFAQCEMVGVHTFMGILDFLFSFKLRLRTDVVPHVFAIEIDDRRMAYDLLCQLQRTNWVHEPPPTLRRNDPLHARFSAPCVNY